MNNDKSYRAGFDARCKARGVNSAMAIKAAQEAAAAGPNMWDRTIGAIADTSKGLWDRASTAVNNNTGGAMLGAGMGALFGALQDPGKDEKGRKRGLARRLLKALGYGTVGATAGVLGSSYVDKSVAGFNKNRDALAEQVVDKEAPLLAESVRSSKSSLSGLQGLLKAIGSSVKRAPASTNGQLADNIRRHALRNFEPGSPEFQEAARAWQKARTDYAASQSKS